jgi:hypothetical protein
MLVSGKAFPPHSCTLTGRQPQPSPTEEAVAPCPLPRTIDLLNALEIILGQLEVVRLHVLVEGGHDGTRVVGVLKSQCMAQLVYSHQEEVIPYGEEQKRCPEHPLRYQLVNLFFFFFGKC